MTFFQHDLMKSFHTCLRAGICFGGLDPALNVSTSPATRRAASAHIPARKDARSATALIPSTPAAAPELRLTLRRLAAAFDRSANSLHFRF